MFMCFWRLLLILSVAETIYQLFTAWTGLLDFLCWEAFTKKTFYATWVGIGCELRNFPYLYLCHGLGFIAHHCAYAFSKQSLCCTRLPFTAHL